LRQFIIFLVLIIVLVAVYQLSRLAGEWHYVVPVEPGELIYTETFDDSGADWTLYDSNTSSTASAVNGVLRLSVGESQTLFWSQANPYFGDFDFTVEARPAESPPTGAVYGVIFRQIDSLNFYAFFISSDGLYKIIRVNDGFRRTISNWHAVPVINQGENVVNRLRVIGYEDTFQFFINDEQVELCIPDSPDGESTPLADGECEGGTWQTTLVDDTNAFGQIGVVIQAEPDPDAVVDFDNIVVYGPQSIE